MIEKKSYSQEDFLNAMESLKKVKLWGFKGYEAHHFLYWTVFQYMLFTKEKRSIKLIIKKLIKQYSSFLIGDVKDKIVFYKSNRYIGRKDMNEIMDRFVNCDENIVVLEEKRDNILFLQSIFYIPCFIQWMIVFAKIGFCRNLQNELLLSTMDILKFLRFLKLNKKHLSEAQAFIVLNDEYCDENIFVQFGKKQNIPTATLQHGFFSKTKKNGTLAQYQHVFANFTADRIFVLSDYQKKVAEESGIPKEKIVSTGIHKFINVELGYKQPHIGRFGVLLSGLLPGIEDTNPKIITIVNSFAAKNNYNYIIKCHPAADEKKYIGMYNDKYEGTVDRDENIIEFAKAIDFAIVGKTSCFFELGYMDVPVFRYQDSGTYDSFSDIEFGRFSDYIELRTLYNKMKDLPQQYQVERKAFKEYCCGNGDITENYKNAIKELIKLRDRSV